jgi:hypothetical protein
VEEREIVEGRGKTSWPGAEADRHEHTVKIGISLCEIIRHHESSERVGSDVLHALLHGASTQRKGFNEVWNCARTKNEADKQAIVGKGADTNS